jgi:hypothetical protein
LEELVDARVDVVAFAERERVPVTDETRVTPVEYADGGATSSLAMDILLGRMLELAREVGYREAQQAIVQERVAQLERSFAHLTETIARRQRKTAPEGDADRPASHDLHAAAAVAEHGLDGSREAGVPERVGHAPVHARRLARFEPIRLRAMGPVAASAPTVARTTPPKPQRRLHWVWPFTRLSVARP